MENELFIKEYKTKEEIEQNAPRALQGLLKAKLELLSLGARMDFNQEEKKTVFWVSIPLAAPKPVEIGQSPAAVAEMSSTQSDDRPGIPRAKIYEEILSVGWSLRGMKEFGQVEDILDYVFSPDGKVLAAVIKLRGKPYLVRGDLVMDDMEDNQWTSFLYSGAEIYGAKRIGIVAEITRLQYSQDGRELRVAVITQDNRKLIVKSDFVSPLNEWRIEDALNKYVNWYWPVYSPDYSKLAIFQKDIGITEIDLSNGVDQRLTVFMKKILSEEDIKRSLIEASKKIPSFPWMIHIMAVSSRSEIILMPLSRTV